MSSLADMECIHKSSDSRHELPAQPPPAEVSVCFTRVAKLLQCKLCGFFQITLLSSNTDQKAASPKYLVKNHQAQIFLQRNSFIHRCRGHRLDVCGPGSLLHNLPVSLAPFHERKTGTLEHSSQERINYLLLTPDQERGPGKQPAGAMGLNTDKASTEKENSDTTKILLPAKARQGLSSVVPSLPDA